MKANDTTVENTENIKCLDKLVSDIFSIRIFFKKSGNLKEYL
jgi:hypothetical protein